MKVNFISIIMISGKKQGTQYEIHFKKKLKVNITKGLTIILYMILQYINGTGYTGIHYIHYTLLVVPNTEAALPCWSAMDTLWRRNERDWGS